MKTSQDRAKGPLKTNNGHGTEPKGTLDPPMRTLGALKLPEEDSEKFRQALAAYGFEKSASFLRRCAYALIKHHQAQEELAQPLAFRVANSHSPKNRSQE